MESIKSINEIKGLKKCASDTKKIVNTLLAELTDYAGMQAELWDRGWFEVKSISLPGNPTIKADIVLEDDIRYNRVKRMTYEVSIRWDGEDNFSYNVQQTGALQYFTVGGLMYCEEINGLN